MCIRDRVELGEQCVDQVGPGDEQFRPARLALDPFEREGGQHLAVGAPDPGVAVRDRARPQCVAEAEPVERGLGGGVDPEGGSVAFERGPPLQDGHLPARAAQADGGGEPADPRPDHDSRARPAPVLAPRTGPGPGPGLVLGLVLVLVLCAHGLPLRPARLTPHDPRPTTATTVYGIHSPQPWYYIRGTTVVVKLAT